MKKILVLFIILPLFICPRVFGKEIRIVSLAPSITEILFAIGLTEKEIVGVVDYSDYPEAAKKIPRIGSLITINIEKIIALEPDHIFSVGTKNSPINARLKAVGLNVIVFNPQSIEEIFSNIQTIGNIVGKEKNAIEILVDIQNRLKVIRMKTEKIKNKKKIYMEIWDDPITSCGKGSLQDEVMRLGGGINIAKDIPIPYPNISQEFIVSQNPDYIIVGYMSRSQGYVIKAISDRFGWQDINAVKSKNIICDIDTSFFLKPGPRIVNGVEEIYKRLYENK